MKHALPKTIILKRRADIRDLFSRGRYQKGEHMDFVYLPGDETRVLFTVSKSVKTKVERNRIKRRLREVYRLQQGKTRASGFLALIGKSGALDQEFGALSTEFITGVARVIKL